MLQKLCYGTTRERACKLIGFYLLLLLLILLLLLLLLFRHRTKTTLLLVSKQKHTTHTRRRTHTHTQHAHLHTQTQQEQPHAHTYTHTTQHTHTHTRNISRTRKRARPLRTNAHARTHSLDYYNVYKMIKTFLSAAAAGTERQRGPVDVARVDRRARARARPVQTRKSYLRDPRVRRWSVGGVWGMAVATKGEIRSMGHSSDPYYFRCTARVPKQQKNH